MYNMATRKLAVKARASKTSWLFTIQYKYILLLKIDKSQLKDKDASSKSIHVQT